MWLLSRLFILAHNFSTRDSDPRDLESRESRSLTSENFSQRFFSFHKLIMSAEASVSYAALILADAELELSSDNLLALTQAAGATVDAVWADVFAKALEGQNLKELLFSFAASAPAASAGASGAAAGGAAAVEAAEEKEEEAAEESDDDMGFGLFD